MTLSTVGAIASTTIPPGLDASSVPPASGSVRFAAFSARSVIPVPAAMAAPFVRFEVACVERKV